METVTETLIEVDVSHAKLRIRHIFSFPAYALPGPQRALCGAVQIPLGIEYRGQAPPAGTVICALCKAIDARKRAGG